MRRAAALLVLLSPLVAEAHVGSPDVVHDGKAGPYRLLVGVRPPEVVPGVAEIEIETPDADITEIHFAPAQMGKNAARFAPTPDLATRTAGSNHYTGRMWMMGAGAWQVRLTVDGARGQGVLGVPVPALPRRTAGMQRALGVLLTALMALLALAAVAIVGAAAGEARLAPGLQLDDAQRRRVRVLMAVTLVIVGAALVGGRAWWNAEADAYGRYVYKPLELQVTVDNADLALALHDPGWLRGRRVDDLVPDHDHLMHLFMVKAPDLSRVYHLHPEPIGDGRFRHALPPGLSTGSYALFADIVHKNGLAETAVARIDLPATPPGVLSGDDAGGPDAVPPLEWLHDQTPLHADRIEWLRFRAKGPLELYMGMLGHAAVIRDDLSTFAHLHPSGSVPMATLVVASGDPHAGHTMGLPETLPSEVAFPYRFPRAGRYRIFVQVKQNGVIETGSFDATVE